MNTLDSVEAELAAAHEAAELHREVVRFMVSEVARLRREADQARACEAAALGLLPALRARLAESEAEVELLRAERVKVIEDAVRLGLQKATARALAAEAEVGRLKREGEEAARLWKWALSGQVAAEDALAALRGEVRVVLKPLEWRPSEFRVNSKACSECLRYDEFGHLHDCRLAALLKRVGP